MAAFAIQQSILMAEPPLPVAVAGTSPAPPQLTNVWLPDKVTAYAVGRYLDPRDGSVVHEAHTLYRREQTSRPNLAPSVALVLPSPGNPAPQDATLLLRDALTAELNTQRATSQVLVRQAESVGELLRSLEARTKEFRDAVRETASLSAQLHCLSNRLACLEGRPTNEPPARLVK